jgi:hypothetical protein
MGCTEGTLCCVSRSTSTDMSSRVQTDTHARRKREKEEEKKGRLKTWTWSDARRRCWWIWLLTQKTVCVYTGLLRWLLPPRSVCVYTHAQLGGESALGYISHCFGQEKKKPKEDGRQTVYCVSISRWIYRAASGRQGAHTSLVGSAAVVCRRSWPF